MAFTKILVPLDGSPVAEQILPFARALAAGLKVPITLLAVIDSAPLLTLTNKAQRFDELSERITAQSELYLKETSEKLRGVAVDWRVEQGATAETIIEIAAKSPATLIAMATHGRSGLDRWLLGSVAEKVLRGSTQPLLLVKTAASGSPAELPIRSIIAPLDGSEVAETVLPTAAALARALHADLLLARAAEIPATAYYRAEGEEDAKAFIPSYDEVLRAATEEAREYLAKQVEALQHQALPAVRPVLMNGPAAEEIIDLAQQTEGSLITLCTHGKSGVTRWLLGSVTEKVVRHGGAPVLVLRPT